MAIVDLLLDIISRIGSAILNLLSWLYERFMDLSLFEKLVVVTFIPAFFAVILAIAKHRLFNTDHYINNTLAVYMIGIVIIMSVTHFFPGKISLLVRVLVNAYYLFWVIYIHASGNIAHTAYTLTIGYYFNLAVPVIFAVISVLSFAEDPG